MFDVVNEKNGRNSSDTLSNLWVIARIGGDTIAAGIAFLRYRVFITVVCLHKSSPATFEVSAGGESCTAAPAQELISPGQAGGKPRSRTVTRVDRASSKRENETY
jgi:hypothetical protein